MISLSSLQKCFKKSLADTELLFFDELDSTNRYLKDYSKKRLDKAFCITTHQTAGYGQRDRQWFNSSNSLTFSLLLPISVAPDGLDGLTQLVALKLVETLSDYTDQSLQIKWPNDIYINGKKVGGILLEIPTFSSVQSWLVVGIGLNIKTDAKAQLDAQIDSVNGGLIEFFSHDQTNISQFLCDLVLNQEQLFENYRQGLFNDYLLNYHLVDYFSKDSRVIVYDNDQNLTGLYKGLNAHGELQVLIDDTLRTYRSGSVSIRPFNY